MLPGFSVFSFQEVSNKLSAAIEWLSSIGLRVDPSRIGQYRRNLDVLIRAYNDDKLDELITEEVANELFTAFYEAAEICHIFTNLMKACFPRDFGGRVFTFDISKVRTRS